MILRMKKYTFLVYHKQYTNFLEKIREIGLLHVIEKPEGIAEYDTLREKMHLATRLKTALKQLEKRTPKDAVLASADNNIDDLKALAKVENTLYEKDLLEQKLQTIQKERDRMEVWGSFSHERLHQLKEMGFIINFYSCNLRKFDQEWEVLHNAFEIDTVGTMRYFITITGEGEKVEIDADPIKLSNKNVQQLDVEINEIRFSIENVKAKLIQMSVSVYNTLKSIQKEVISDIDFSKVLLNTQSEAADKVMLLEGWCPEEAENELNTFLAATDVYYETTIPTDEEKVPIKLKNNSFTKLFEMIGELYDLPNYHELDLTPFFAPFYMLFFGLCLGDVGYGLIFVIAAIVFRNKVNPALKPILTLLTWLGASTVVMGAISGNIFGYSLIESKTEWLETYKQYMLDPNKLFTTSLILGGIQIIFGITLKAVGTVRRYGFAASLSTWGWIILILGCGGTYALATFTQVPPENLKWLYIGFGGIGGLLVFVLNDIKRNPLINVGAGLWDAYNMVLGLIGDLLSYVRLFALGISGSVMGFVFNDLAINLSGTIPVLSPIIMILIMLIGHSINIFMSSLSSFVHPMRLTFVEFYKNSGFEGGGKKYSPFAPYKEEKTLF